MTGNGFAGRHVAITGGAGGIGMAIARAFLAEAAQVSLVDIDAGRLAEATDALGTAGRVHAVRADISDAAQATRAVAEVETKAGAGIDILVNNAGVILRGIPVAEIPAESWDWIMGVNFLGPVNMVRAALPGMLARSAGHVVTLGSISGFVVGTRQSGAYAASKFALTAYMEALAADLAGGPIGVSLIAPAGVATRLYDNSAAIRTGPPIPGAMDETPPDTAAATAPDIIAAEVLRAVRERRFLTFPHPETRAWIEERQAAILSAFE